MGYKLRRDLREALGPDITGLQRAVALEIADDAKEETRISWATLDDLVRWTGAKDGAVVRNALKRLAAAGWEFRIPIGVAKKDGRVMYAKPGIRMTFRVPDFEVPDREGEATATPIGGAPATPKEGATAPPREGATATPQGGAGAHSEGATAHSEGAGATPYSSDPSTPHVEEDIFGTEEATATPASPIRRITAEEKLEFGRFWHAHPKSKDYDKTLAAWTEAVLAGTAPVDLTAAALAYGREVASTNFQYVKQSANWLRDRRYEDKFAPEPTSGRPQLKAVSGGYQPYKQPSPEDYANDLGYF
ncbi:hypothetical protein [Streptomyces sp. NPDC008240]|uniref:hypothetical protein n=1 Tax=Streptomyces sp. NPDC008240 TaxID=3364822 RepID=UPI0036EE0643